MVLNLEKVGLTIEVHHHEVGTAGQAEIDMRYDTLLDDRRQRHEVQVRRQEHGVPGRQDGDVHAEAAVHGQRLGHAHAPDAVDRRREPVLGRGRLRRASATRRAGTSAGCSRTRRRCSRSRTPRRTRTGGWCRATRRRSSWCTASGTAARACGSRSARRARRPSASSSGRPDPSCNPYLAFSAMLMAGIDGIKNKIEPPDPMDKDLYDLPPEEHAAVKQVPGSLLEVLERAGGRPPVAARGRRVHAGRDRHLDRVQAARGARRGARCDRTRTSSSCTTTSRPDGG